MAVLTMSSAVVKVLPGLHTITTKTTGEALALHDALFIVTSSGTGTVGTVMKLLDTTAEKAQFYGIALAPAASGDDVPIQTSGTFGTVGSTFVAGETYYASATAGKAVPALDGAKAGATYQAVAFTAYEDDRALIVASAPQLVA